MADSAGHIKNGAFFQLLAALDKYEAALETFSPEIPSSAMELDRALAHLRLFAAGAPELSVEWVQILIEHRRLQAESAAQQPDRSNDQAHWRARLEVAVENARNVCLKHMTRH